MDLNAKEILDKLPEIDRKIVINLHLKDDDLEILYYILGELYYSQGCEEGVW